MYLVSERLYLVAARFYLVTARLYLAAARLYIPGDSMIIPGGRKILLVASSCNCRSFSVSWGGSSRNSKADGVNISRGREAVGGSAGGAGEATGGAGEAAGAYGDWLEKTVLQFNARKYIYAWLIKTCH